MTTITELTDEQIGDIYKTEFAVEDPGSSFVIRFARAIITASRAKSAALSTPATASEPPHDAGLMPLIEDYAKAVHDGDDAACIVLKKVIVASLEQSTPATAPEQCWCDEHGIGEPGVSCGDCPTRDYKVLATAPEFPTNWAQMLHYPQCWDTAAYPELRDAIHEALAWSGCSACKPATEPDAKHMASRLMGWPLPKDFSPDGGISFDGRKDDEWNKNKQWPIGTNLLTFDQAVAMFEYALSAETAPEPCKGIEIEPGVFSGCDQSAGDCPVCGK